MYLAAYQFTVSLNQDGTIPPYTGSVFRHSFEKSFRKIACPAPEDQSPECILSACPATYLFDQERQKQALLKQKKDTHESAMDIPKPFIWETPFYTQPYDKKKNDELTFNLILIGKAIALLPLFFMTMNEVGRVGLADGTLKFTVVRVSAIDALQDIETDLFSLKTPDFTNVSHFISFNKVAQGFKGNEYSKIDKATIEFLTPFRVKRTQKALEKPEFFLIARPLLRRLLSLSRFHCNTNIRMDYKKIMNDASKITISKNNIEWFDWGKYSPKNESQSQIGGLFGTVEYKGPIGSLIPYLIFGQLVHVGKNTSYGLGKYRIDFELPSSS